MGDKRVRRMIWRVVLRCWKVEVVDGDDDGDAPRTKARGVLSKPTTKARLKLRVARVE